MKAYKEVRMGDDGVESVGEVEVAVEFGELHI
jgi:hypothetical protein